MIQIIMFFLFSTMVQAKDPVATVAYVDLPRYAGKWFEIASIPQFFQRKCASDTSAEYKLQPNGKVSVLNSCKTSTGRMIKAQGQAKVVDSQTNAKLKVTFVKLFKWIYSFGGKYWVLDLDEDYSYALIGDPTRKYSWILSRTPSLDQEKLQQVINKLKDNGYDPCLLRMTVQTGGNQLRRSLCDIESVDHY